MKTIRTVRGEILPDQLGFTTMHEHTIADMAQLVAAQQM
jgi:predicted metal-dependent phosphotriesterase family hydrolase